MKPAPAPHVPCNTEAERFDKAIALGLWFLYSGVRVAVERTMLRARNVLLASVIYLPLLYGLLLDRPLR